MTVVGWLQISLVLALVVLAARPLGIFFYRIVEGETAPWLDYTLAMLMFSVAGFLLLYAMQRLQNFLPAFSIRRDSTPYRRISPSTPRSAS
jgi:potassium-transporting ATPase potassium-binding subunit